MWNTEGKAKVKRQKAKVRAVRARRGSLRLLFTFCLLPFAFYLSACRMDMQDQPKYKTFRAADKKTFADGQSARPLVEGTVPRVPAGQPYVDRQTDYFYTGRMTGAQGGASGASAQPGSTLTTTAGGAARPASPATGDENARGQVAGPGNAAQGTSAAATGTGRLGGPDVFPFPITLAVLERGQDRFNNFCAMCHGMTGDADGMIVRRGFQRPPSFHDPGLQEGQASAAHYFQIITNGLGAMPSYSYMIPPEDRWKIIAYIRALQLARKGTVDDVPADKRGSLSRGGTQEGQKAPQEGERH